MSELQDAIALLVEVFHSYSGKEGDKYKLSKAELKNLLVAELPFVQKNNTAIQKKFQDLDQDRDGEVDFTEYVTMVASLAVDTNDYFQKMMTAV